MGEPTKDWAGRSLHGSGGPEINQEGSSNTNFIQRYGIDFDAYVDHC